MKTQTAFIVSIFVVVLSAVSDGLAIGFEVDTPLDPFLGGLTKIKRHIVKRIKDLSSDDRFINASPADQISMLFSQPSLVLPPFSCPDQPVNTQLPLSQRRFNQVQIPNTQQLNSQFTAFNNPFQTTQRPAQGSNARFFGVRNLPELVQQLTQILPISFGNQFSDTRSQQRFF